VPIFVNPVRVVPWVERAYDLDQLFYRLKRSVPIGIVIQGPSVVAYDTVPDHVRGDPTAVVLMNGTSFVTQEQAAILEAAGYGEYLLDTAVMTGYGSGVYGAGVYGGA
jgi:hypothetical protein